MKEGFSLTVLRFWHDVHDVDTKSKNDGASIIGPCKAGPLLAVFRCQPWKDGISS